MEIQWYIEVGKAIKEIGIPIASFGLLTWLIVYIVKKLTTSIDELVVDNKTSAIYVREEHKQQSDHHKALMGEHKEIAAQLQETAIVLARINGYKKED